MAITPLPPPPSRQEPQQFADKADALLGQLPQFVTEANALSADVNALTVDAIAAKDIALSTMAYDGDWSSLTGALNVPSSVSHEGKLWILDGDLADVTAAEPGVDVRWRETSTQYYVEFTASGTWLRPPGIKFVVVDIVAGGGGGSNKRDGGASSGGSGGEGILLFFRQDQVPASVDIDVGAGGDGAPADSSSAGSDGGDSAFGTLATAKGGRGGLASAQYATPGRSDVGLITDASLARAFPWSNAAAGAGSNTVRGGGGGDIGLGPGTSEIHGDGGTQGSSGVKGGDGEFPGGGGGRGVNNGTTGGGGNGGNGVVRVWAW